MTKLKLFVILGGIATGVYYFTDFVANSIAVFDRFLAKPIADGIDKAGANYKFDEHKLNLSSPLNNILGDLSKQHYKYVKVSESLDSRLFKMDGFLKETDFLNKKSKLEKVSNCQSEDCIEMVFTLSLVQNAKAKATQNISLNGMHITSIRLEVSLIDSFKDSRSVLIEMINGIGTSTEESMQNAQLKLINWLNRNYNG